MNGSGPIFCSLSRAGTPHQVPPHTPLTPQGIMTIVQRIAQRAGLTDPTLAPLKPHDLRRSAAQMAKEGGADFDTIKHMLGHASMVTTERYLSQIQNLKLGQTAPDHIKVRTNSIKRKDVLK